MPRNSETSESSSLPFKHVEYRLSGGRRLATTVRDSLRMSDIRRSATAAETTFRSVCRAAGVRLAPPLRKLPGSPDLVNLRQRLAVFVHGCFWHAHSGCVRATVPKRNRSFWVAKFRRNKERDRDVAAQLHRLGFRVFTVWECEVEDTRQLARRVRSLERNQSGHGVLDSRSSQSKNESAS